VNKVGAWGKEAGFKGNGAGLKGAGSKGKWSRVQDLTLGPTPDDAISAATTVGADPRVRSQWEREQGLGGREQGSRLDRDDSLDVCWL